MDMTERKTDEDRIRVLLEEKDLLLKEFHHRGKNSMNSISGILLMQAMKTGNAVARMLEDAERRVCIGRGFTFLILFFFATRTLPGCFVGKVLEIFFIVA
jgi:hypothetical protein